MWSYIFKRLLLVIPTLIGIQTIMFFVSEFVPGGPLDQLYAKLRGETGDALGKGQGEVAKVQQGAKKDDKKKEIDSKEEMRLMRALGLNKNRGERYLQTLLWHSRSSFISSKEVDDKSSSKAFMGDQAVIVYRDDGEAEKYFVYRNSFATSVSKKTLEQKADGTTEQTISQVTESGEVVFDKEKKAFRSVIDNTILFDYKTGRQLGGEGQLLKYSIDIKKETFTITRPQKDGTKATIKDVRDEVYLRESFVESMFNWDNWHGFFLLKFPVSDTHNKKSLTLIRERLPVSAWLGVSSFFLTYVGCIVLGIMKAVKCGTRFDTYSSVVILIGYSIPGFVLAVLLLQNFGPTDDAIMQLIPPGGIHSPKEVFEKLSFFGKIWDSMHHMAAPIICLTIGSFAGLTLLTRNSILEQFNQLYAVAARARGLSERKVLFKHILRNSMIPLVTGFPARFLMMFLGGSLLIEKIFNLDGLGLLGFNAVSDRDFPLIMSNLFIFTIIGLTCRILTDICYVIVDPRISFEESKS